MKDPDAKMWSGLVAAFVLIALAIFLSAGTLNYWQGWLYMVVGVVSSVLPELYICCVYSHPNSPPTPSLSKKRGGVRG